MNNNADARENENIETNIIKKNSEIIDKEGNIIYLLIKMKINQKQKFLKSRLKKSLSRSAIKIINPLMKMILKQKKKFPMRKNSIMIKKGY